MSSTHPCPTHLETSVCHQAKAIQKIDTYVWKDSYVIHSTSVMTVVSHVFHYEDQNHHFFLYQYCYYPAMAMMLMIVLMSLMLMLMSMTMTRTMHRLLFWRLQRYTDVILDSTNADWPPIQQHRLQSQQLPSSLLSLPNSERSLSSSSVLPGTCFSQWYRYRYPTSTDQSHQSTGEKVLRLTRRQPMGPILIVFTLQMGT